MLLYRGILAVRRGVEIACGLNEPGSNFLVWPSASQSPSLRRR